MKDAFISLVNSAVFWAAVTTLLGYLANTVVSRGWVANLPPTSPAKRAIRAVHGFINRIDPMAVILAASVMLAGLTSACASTPAPKSAPTAIEYATLACNLTDDALTGAILLAPVGQLAKFEQPVAVLARVEASVRAGVARCDDVASLAPIADAVGCRDCATAISLAKAQVCK